MANSEINKEIVFKSDICPICGGTNSLMGNLWNKQAEKMNNPPVGQAALVMAQALAMDPSKPPLFGALVPQGTAILDVCTDCGVVFARIAMTSLVKLTPDPIPGQSVRL